jgi:hypothetical protein
MNDAMEPLMEWMVGIGLRKNPAIRKTKKGPGVPSGAFSNASF